MDKSGERVLVVDDEDAICELLDFGLSQAGFTVETVPDGRRALEVITDAPPSAIILDVMLPMVDGLTLVPMIRRLTDAPIIMLSAKGDTADRVAGLMRGADDYLGKPFDMDELVARLESALRRPHLRVRELLRYGDVVVDVPRHTVQRRGRDIDLSQREFDLLLAFMRNATHVLTRAQLLDLVWGSTSDVNSSTIDTYVSYLRAKIDNGFEPKLIHTVRGIGYMLRDKSQ
ncbi:MAG TPA: response regulator transcription factor [Candidatus Elarobacter sp.]|jgi:DNA-binding response OmpR family regulator